MEIIIYLYPHLISFEIQVFGDLYFKIISSWNPQQGEECDSKVKYWNNIVHCSLKRNI